MNERKGRELQTQEIKVVQHNPAYRDSWGSCYRVLLSQISLTIDIVQPIDFIPYRSYISRQIHMFHSFIMGFHLQKENTLKGRYSIRTRETAKCEG